jgi:hypothetical protein
LIFANLSDMAERFYELLNHKRFEIIYNKCGEIVLFHFQNDDTLTLIPEEFPLTKCKNFKCRNCKLSRLPNTLFNCEEIDCSNNLLIELPTNLYKCKRLKCDNNLLTTLPNCLSECTSLVCSDNELEFLPIMINLNYLWICNNFLFSFDINFWIKIWDIRRAIVARRIFYKWKCITKKRRLILRFQCLKSIKRHEIIDLNNLNVLVTELQDEYVQFFININV